MTLQDEIVRFCSPAERTFWEILDHFPDDGDDVSLAVRVSVVRGDLIRTEGGDCFLFRAAFPGVDIDAAHLGR